MHSERLLNDKLNIGLVEKLHDDPEKFDFFYMDNDREYSVKAYQVAEGIEWDEKVYLISHEYGPNSIVFADNESNAYEIWVDNQNTIEQDEVHEAYGAYDALREHMASLGHEDTVYLRRFCINWAPIYFKIMAPKATQDDDPCSSLIEGYEYQSNSTDTGIVEVGHYTRIDKISKDKIYCTLKPEPLEDL